MNYSYFGCSVRLVGDSDVARPLSYKTQDDLFFQHQDRFF